MRGFPGGCVKRGAYPECTVRNPPAGADLHRGF